jgi:FG-GAP repeat
MRAHRLAVGAAVAAAVVVPPTMPAGALGASAGATATAATCWRDSSFPVPRGALDGDTISDVVVGLPTEHSSAGAVDLHLSTAPAMRLTRDMVAGFGPATAGDRFGAAVALGNDVDGDSCSDLAIGAPGERGAGAVHVVLGGPHGVSRTDGLTVREPDPQAGDRFGAAVAMSGFDLWVGAPGRAVNGHPGAGAVYHYYVHRTGTGLVADRVHVLTQASPGIAGAPEAGDHFGAALSADTLDVLIGIPGEDVDGRRDAGMVEALMGDDGSSSTTRFTTIYEAVGYTQSSPGVEGAPEVGDRFGAAVAMLGSTGVIGIPGEDIGRRRDAGAVQLLDVPQFSNPPLLRFSPGKLVTQGANWNGLHIAGWPETGDRFGASVAVTNGLFGNAEPEDIVVGAPGEDIAGRADAGAVSVFGIGPDCETCPPQAAVRYRGHGLPGPLRAGDAVGASVEARTWPHPTDGEYIRFDGELLAGAPGSPVGGRSAVGEVLLPGTALQPLADPRAGLRYGAVVGRGMSASGT